LPPAAVVAYLAPQETAVSAGQGEVMHRKFAIGAALAALPCTAFAQAPAGPLADSGDTGWLLASAALVLLMTLPGLGLFYGGLVRAKNLLSVLLQIGAVTAIASLLWIVVGYTLAFGSAANGWLGSGALMLGGLGALRSGLTVPESAFAMFQLTFAAITPALMIGAWVDRARFGWVVGFCALWGCSSTPRSRTGCGAAAGCAGGRARLRRRHRRPHHRRRLGARRRAAARQAAGLSRPGAAAARAGLTMLGAMLLWVGWFGFNGGSALAANGGAASAIINTHVAASMAALVWLAIERVTFGKPTTVGFATGAIAGLATITPGAGFVSPGAAMAIGAIAAVVCYFAIQLVKNRLRIDDSLDVFAVHGVGGMLGSLLLALFLSPALGGAGYAEGMTMPAMLGAQALGVAAVALWSAILTAACALGSPGSCRCA
jgi:Amt family ammonium transporter